MVLNPVLNGILKTLCNVNVRHDDGRPPSWTGWTGCDQKCCAHVIDYWSVRAFIIRRYSPNEGHFSRDGKGVVPKVYLEPRAMNNMGDSSLVRKVCYSEYSIRFVIPKE